MHCMWSNICGICFSEPNFVRYMENVFAYIVSKESLDPSEGIELSGEGVIFEVEKMKAEELKEITKKIKEVQRLAEDLEKEQTVDDDKSEDWVPPKGFEYGLCMDGSCKKKQCNCAKFLECFFLHRQVQGCISCSRQGQRCQKKAASGIQASTDGSYAREEALLDAGLEGESVKTWVWSVCVHGVCMCVCE